jgi:hypothetical protein
MSIRTTTRTTNENNQREQPTRNEIQMTTMLMQELKAGDVIEIKTSANVGDDVMTVLVLLVTDEFVVLDPCNDSTPFVSRCTELVAAV